MREIYRILRVGGKLWKYYAGIGFFTILLSLMNLLQPMFSGWAINELHKGNHASVHYVVWLAIALFLLDVLANFFSNFGGYLGDQMALKLNRYLSWRYYQHLLSLPQAFFDTELTGKIINRLNRSINQITNFIQMMSNNFLQMLFTTVFTLAVVFHYSWQVGLMLLSLYPLYILLTSKSSPKWRGYQAQKNHYFDVAGGRFGEVINQIKVVKSFLQERHELGYFAHQYDAALEINRPQSKYWHSRDVLRRLVLNVIFFGVYLYIFVQGSHGNLSPGVVVALILYGMQIRNPIFTISMIVDSAQRSISDSRDYFEIMDTQPQIADRPDAGKLHVSAGAITFDHLSFGYDTGTTVLHGVDFAIKPRSKNALVGESGEGKSTLTNLLMRLYDPVEGRILIDGQDITQVTQASLRDCIGVVFQEPALFSGTIRENIAYARPSATLARIEAAAKAANAHDFISKFEKGYDTEIGERGLRLSGGQKQRIAIARAILKDPPILILDEATSSLDSKSEAMVQEALERLMRDRTTLIIAHRLSTIQHVDQIITLRQGRVDEIGSPRQLAKTDGIYAQLLKLQQHHDRRTERRLKDLEIIS